MPKKVLVTGGTGFIGRKLVARLLDLGYEVVVPTRRVISIPLTPNPRLHYAQLDLLDLQCAFEECLKGCEMVFHCAGELKDEQRMYPLHVTATYNLLNAFVNELEAAGISGRWIQLSSVGVYGPVSPANKCRVVTEEAVPDPVGEYEVTKAKSDDILKEMAQKHVKSLAYTILRPSNVCGPGMPNRSLQEWAWAIKNGLFFFIGSSEAISTYVHVNDVVEALVLCASSKKSEGQIFNISNDCLQIDLVKAIANASGKSCPTLRVSEGLARLAAKIFCGLRSFPLKKSRVDSLVSRTSYPSEKLRCILGFSFTKNIPDSIQEILME